MNGERALRILICSNGSEGSDRVVRTAGLIAGPGAAETTLLGIRERRRDENALHEVLLAQQRVLEISGAKVELVSAPGEPITRRLWKLGGRVTAPLRDAVKPDRSTGG
jgi:K+-sensing histidine kinase KdpD